MLSATQSRDFRLSHVSFHGARKKARIAPLIGIVLVEWTPETLRLGSNGELLSVYLRVPISESHFLRSGGRPGCCASKHLTIC